MGCINNSSRLQVLEVWRQRDKYHAHSILGHLCQVRGFYLISHRKPKVSNHSTLCSDKHPPCFKARTLLEAKVTFQHCFNRFSDLDHSYLDPNESPLGYALHFRYICTAALSSLDHTLGNQLENQPLGIYGTPSLPSVLDSLLHWDASRWTWHVQRRDILIPPDPSSWSSLYCPCICCIVHTSIEKLVQARNEKHRGLVDRVWSDFREDAWRHFDHGKRRLIKLGWIHELRAQRCAKPWHRWGRRGFKHFQRSQCQYVSKLQPCVRARLE